MSSAKQVYEERRQQGQLQAQEYREKARLFPWLRAGLFLGSLVVVIRVWSGELKGSWLWLALGLFVGFVMAALRHQFLQRKREDAELLERVNARAGHRINGTWHEFEPRGEQYMTPEHPYGQDLDIFGQGSLFQMINVTTTWFGQRTLARWLLEKENPDVLRVRQAQVADLAPRLDLRQDIEREGLRIAADPQKADPESFLQWVEAPPLLLQKTWLFWTSIVLPAWVFVLMSYWMYKVLPPWLAGAMHPAKFAPYSAWWWFLPWLAVIVLFVQNLRTCQQVFANVIFHERAFSLYRALFARIDAEPAAGTPLGELQKRLRAQGMAPHEAMKRLQWWIDLAEVRQSPIIFFPMNLLFLWDVHCLFGMERWKRQVGGVVRSWFRELGELEALSSLAGHSFDAPENIFPEFCDKGQEFVAEGLGHPLLHPEKCVRNDVSLTNDRPLILITGSNMSGKSTMLRAIGLNAVLAYAGGAVCAKRLKLSMMQVGTSMRITDSLEHGVSYFMAELKRIHRILSLRNEETPLLFLLDEILHGTNTRERRIAALGIIELLQQTHAIGCVTTHDLELAEQCKKFEDRVHFAFFTDLIEDGQMKFDYHLREGICGTTNALRLMRIVGIPIPEHQDETTSALHSVEE